MVRAGHIQTEVGIVPDDWDVATLASTCSFENGDRGENYPNASLRASEGVPFVNAGHLLGGRIAIEEMDYISRERFNQLRSGKFAPGDILFCLRGSLGKFGVVGSDLEEGAIASSLIIVRPRSDVLHARYLAAYFESDFCARMIDRWAGGAAQPNLGAKSLARFVIPLPAKCEQEAIAGALSDADALIESLEKLIAKKRQIKQGAMQELLTGKTRLPGFSGEWKMVRAGDIGRFRGGSGFPTRFQGTSSGEYPFFKVSDMNNEGNETFMKAANNYIGEAVRQQLGAVAFPSRSIVFAKVGAAIFLERKKILAQASCLDNNMAALVLDSEQADCRFIHYVLLSTKLGDLVNATALPSLNGTVLAAIGMALPPLPSKGLSRPSSLTWTTRSRHWRPNSPRPAKSSRG